MVAAVVAAAVIAMSTYVLVKVYWNMPWSRRSLRQL